MTNAFDSALSGLHFVGFDDVAVDQGDYERAKSGDRKAMRRLKKAIKGIELYEHGLRTSDGQIIVSLSKLHDMGIVDSVVIQVCE